MLIHPNWHRVSETMGRHGVVGARAAGLQAVLGDRGGLYERYDCPRVANLVALAERLEAGSFP